MIELQCINKCLTESRFQFLINNGITEDYFILYKDEFNFIQNHFKQYHNVPDKTTFLSKFPKFKLFDIRETDNFIVDKLRENHLYNTAVPHLEQAAKLLSEDANKAVDYINKQFNILRPSYHVTSVDFVKTAMERYQSLQDRKNNPNKYRYSFGLDKLDYHTLGIKRGEELVVIFARSGVGKTWIGTKVVLELFKQGANVGVISPEMTPEAINYRLDTMLGHFSNFHLKQGTSFTQDEEYLAYLKGLSQYQNKIITSTVNDFNKEITVSKLKHWVLDNNLQAILIDGIGYLKDERYRRGDNKTISLTNISEDLMSLSVEISIPIILVHQSSRDAVKEDVNAMPELHHLRDSDGIAHNASKVFSLRVDDRTLFLRILKNRDGADKKTLTYLWDIDKGYFEYIPSEKSGILEDVEEIKELIKKAEETPSNEDDIF